MTAPVVELLRCALCGHRDERTVGEPAPWTCPECGSVRHFRALSTTEPVGSRRVQSRRWLPGVEPASGSPFGRALGVVLVLAVVVLACAWAGGAS